MRLILSLVLVVALASLAFTGAAFPGGPGNVNKKDYPAGGCSNGGYVLTSISSLEDPAAVELAVGVDLNDDGYVCVKVNGTVGNENFIDDMSNAQG